MRAGFAIGDDYTEILRSNLTNAAPRRRVLALRGMVRQGLVTPAQWVSAIDDLDVDVRREALNQVAYAASLDAAVVEAIERQLDDEDPLVVDGAIFALGEHLYAGAVERLCEIATSHDDARCRESAIAALGAIGDDRARRVILAALDDKPPVRRRAVVALANFEGPDVDAALERARNDRDWQVRAAADQLAIDEI